MRNYLSLTDVGRVRRSRREPYRRPSAEYLPFDDDDPTGLVTALSTATIAIQLGRRVAVFRRPRGIGWENVAEIRGHYECGAAHGARDERGGGESTITEDTCSCPLCKTRVTA